ncbi:acyl-[acyl-carrier-protein] thioesterase [Schleiferilactobacillus perolens]|jgi:medium-chain acyl-[acyl-carrier-protein] hydrolase|uniref:Oleoyl-[acyl-carrier protein] thioesterase n=1 Tax=Schleiferilactobacillus perolens DSM 12744 TaxID=1423792 RepID=A0A0R1MKT8_9LACO|nr:acyl-ACP thioesterase domain-containing protein [Schleiferilactobacillus perolens]KRL08496.1 oleoyl-[acyl-carrier protein] thioesterase [Schleiferilactobacillus perolens DSM 12744]MCI1891271.1 thioesterase [Schleiferilactobacillus harbinensis]MCI1912709.1 thioesterase [Schleiferilactobacillus harbinensis]MCI2172509.1 thioesterase [Schleiferilactobacillus perolens]
MALVWSEKYTIPYFQVNTREEMHLSSLLNVLVMASEHQTEALGVGEDKTHAHGVGWVITQYHMAFQRMPKVGDQVELRTAATSRNRFFCYRDFWVMDDAGQEMVHITATFVMMSFATRKMVPIIDELVAPFHTAEEKKVLKFPRITKMDYTGAPAKPYRVRYQDIDSNHHVNNVHYFDWMIDTLPLDFILHHRLVQVDIRYEREIQYGDTAESLYLSDTENPLITHHLIRHDGETNTEAIYHWEED